MVVEGNHWALHFGESGEGKAPDSLSSDKTGSYRNKYEIPLTMEDPWELLQKTGISPGFTVCHWALCIPSLGLSLLICNVERRDLIQPKFFKNKKLRVGHIIFFNNQFLKVKKGDYKHLGMTHISWKPILLPIFLLPIVFHNVTVL